MTADVRAQLEEAMSAQHGCDTLLSTSGRPCNRCCQSAKALLPVIADVKDAAEARGRAEVAVRVRELATLLDLTADGHREHRRDRERRDGIAVGYNASADRLRTLAEEVLR